MLDTNKIYLLSELVKKELGQDLKELNFLGRGACNNLYYCKLQNLQELVIKEERYDKLDYEINDLTIEAKIVNALNHRGVVKIPKIQFINEKYKIYSYKYLRGTTLDSQMSKFSEQEFETLIDDLCKFHAKLHSVVLKKDCPEITTVDSSQFFHDASTKLSNLLETCDENEEIYSLLKQVKNQLEVHSHIRTKTALIQGDAHPGNIIVDNNKFVGIIDFGKCEVADIHIDFSHYIRAFPEYTDKIIESYWKYTKYRLSKDRLLLFAVILDISKTTYHIDRLIAGKVRVENNIRKLNKLLAIK